MTAEAFKAKWTSEQEPLQPISAERLERYGLSERTAGFLSLAGLPTSTGQELSFGDDTDDDVYGVHKLTEHVAGANADKSFEKYVVIGSCRDGDVIAINTDTDEIEQLDHEDNYRSQFFNSSIETLAEFLMLFRDFEQEILEGKNPDDPFQCYNFTDWQFSELKAKMRAVDERAVTVDGFWKDELAIMSDIRMEKYG
jgi:hypothetical protein